MQQCDQLLLALPALAGGKDRFEYLRYRARHQRLARDAAMAGLRPHASDYERIRQYSMKPMPSINSNKNRAKTRGPISAAKRDWCIEAALAHRDPPRLA